MDERLEYIKMCERAEGIQIESIHDDDYIIVRDRSENKLKLYEGLRGFHKEPFLSPTGVTITVIPRQDQLQEMVSFVMPPINYLGHGLLPSAFSPKMDLDSFHEWVNRETNKKYTDGFASMEQLWLAFVMKSRYSKVWNGEDWVKEWKSL